MKIVPAVLTLVRTLSLTIRKRLPARRNEVFENLEADVLFDLKNVDILAVIELPWPVDVPIALIFRVLWSTSRDAL